MKTLLTGALVTAALLAGSALAGDPPAADSTSTDGQRGLMRADTDHDGRISRAEAEAASSQRSNGWFDKLDLNKDGYVTQDEMKQARDNRMAEMKAKAEERFKEADTNGDGKLSLDEVQAKMPKLAGRFSTLDKNGDGQLSPDELAAARHGHGWHGKHGPAAT